MSFWIFSFSTFSVFVVRAERNDVQSERARATTSGSLSHL